MLAAMLAIVLSAVVLGGDAARAAPAGSAVERRHATDSFVEPVHCRRWPHWHSGAKPHGFGFGCGLKKPKRGRSARPTTSEQTSWLPFAEQAFASVNSQASRRSHWRGFARNSTE